MVIMVTTNYTFSKIIRLLPSSVAYIYICASVCVRACACVYVYFWQIIIFVANKYLLIFLLTLLHHILLSTIAIKVWLPLQQTHL